MLSRALHTSLTRHVALASARPSLLCKAVSRAGPRSFSSPSFRGALLNATSDDRFYARKMDLAEAAAMMAERGLLWRAAQADVAAPPTRWDSVDEYLAEVEAKADLFKDDKILLDREEVVAVLRKLLYKKGTLALVLGGKSVGKTFLMTKLAQELNDETAWERVWKNFFGPSVRRRRVAIVNARKQGSDLVKGITVSLATDPTFFEKFRGDLPKLTQAWVTAALDASTLKLLPSAAEAAGTTAGTLVKAPLTPTSEPPSLDDVVEAYVKACEEEKRYPCLIIEEANVAFSSKDTERTKDALRLLTSLTKEQDRMSVFITASEHSEHFRLRELGYKADHWSNTVLVPELAPKAMRDVLVGKWGMGPNLADAMMSVWGGHLLGTYQGLGSLALAKEEFAAWENPIVFSDDAQSGAETCVGIEAEDKTMKGMDAMLRKVAEVGYAAAPKAETDPRVKLASDWNVLGVVTGKSITPSLVHSAVFPKSQPAVVATLQSMRPLLALKFSEKEGGKAGTARGKA